MLPRVAIVGPTAVGKTAVGVALALERTTEIVSADALQVYRGMDIGTAKPTREEQAQVHFHVIDVVAPDADWTLADYQTLGHAACDMLASRGLLPLIVGGSGLYVRALTTVLDIPHTPPNDTFRSDWHAQATAHGAAFVQAELAKVDPQAAARIHVNDLGRLIRALEVYQATGVPLSEWHARNRERTEALPVRIFGLNFADRRRLYARIEARVEAMLADGFVDEVRGLLAQGYAPTLRPLQSLGYRHLGAYLSGAISYTEAVEEMKRDTRHFARRQLIWFRADPRIHWLEAADKTAAQLAAEIASHLEADEHNTKDVRSDEQTAA